MFSVPRQTARPAGGLSRAAKHADGRDRAVSGDARLSCLRIAVRPYATAREDGTIPGPVFGHIPGYPVGSCFENRAELADAGVHRHRQAGISGSASKGADSIVLSGGYEDDEDHGDVIVYTGYGGRDPDTGQQVSDQPFAGWNMALARSGLDGLPVRVIRGEGHDSPFSPNAGYRYDGLCSVDDCWHDTGRSGYLIWRYRLAKILDPVHRPDDLDA